MKSATNYEEQLYFVNNFVALSFGALRIFQAVVLQKKDSSL